MMRDYVEFAKAFEKCEIDAAEFSHRDHLGVAHEFLGKYDFVTALAKYSQCIKTIATNAGAATKFNTTITLAFLAIVSERMEHASCSTFDEFIEANQDLMSRDLLSSWYSAEQLGSDAARTRFLMPSMQT